MEPDWERVQTTNDIPSGICITDRLRVEGGWLYRTRQSYYASAVAIAMVFVPVTEERER